MKFTTSLKKPESKKLDLLVYGVCEGDAIEPRATAEGFQGKLGQLFYTHPDKGPRAMALVGLGEKAKLTPDSYRKWAASAAKIAQDKQAVQLGLVLAPKASVQAVVEGASLALYRFDRHLSQKTETCVEEITLFTPAKNAQKEIAVGEAIAAGVRCARDLINEGPTLMNPAAMAKAAQEEAKTGGLQVEILDPKALEKEGFHLLLAVGRGSSDFAEPRVIKLSYKPSKKAKKHWVLVGKGVTFDSGGLDMKPSDGMLHMKTDMSGAAAVLGTMKIMAALQPEIAVTGYLACVENGVDSRSYHPGDIIVSRKGLSVEINNTDAEGRLVLADTLHYAQEVDKPDVLIDIATLTGACMVALGPTMAGLFSNDDPLSARVLDSARFTGEAFWRLPLEDSLYDQLKTPIADLKNTGERYGGAITAALFLQKFIEPKTVWAHLDIAGPARNDRDQGYLSTGGTGFGVRTLVDLILNHA
ncbi:MAG: leucyl aminopeptidase [Myxococcaceae bacterium]|nr:leucyl aminopeptidase [Myxococcaceae bacterium]MBH2005876.1 leucyl aminopeptidase [Myxococcaceae bacterium]